MNLRTLTIFLQRTASRSIRAVTVQLTFCISETIDISVLEV